MVTTILTNPCIFFQITKCRKFHHKNINQYCLSLQVKQDYIQSNLANIDQDTAVQLACFGIRHYFKDTNQSSDKKHHIDYIEKEIGFSNFLPKSVIEAMKQKQLKKLLQAGYKKVYNFSEMDFIFK